MKFTDSVPNWANWVVIAGSWLVSFLQPLALFVTIAWCGLQAYIAWQKYKHWKKTTTGGKE